MVILIKDIKHIMIILHNYKRKFRDNKTICTIRTYDDGLCDSCCWIIYFDHNRNFFKDLFEKKFIEEYLKSC